MLDNGYARCIINNALGRAIAKFNNPNPNPSRFATRLVDGITLQLPFYSDTTASAITRYARMVATHPIIPIHKRGRDIRDITKMPATTMCGAGQNADRCELCPHLPKNMKCSRRGTVYQFRCSHCDGTYIGKANRSIRDRFMQHKREVTANSRDNPLVAHLISCPNTHPRPAPRPNLARFTLSILNSFKPGLQTDLAEAWHIRTLNPTLNRKQELTTFF